MPPPAARVSWRCGSAAAPGSEAARPPAEPAAPPAPACAPPAAQGWRGAVPGPGGEGAGCALPVPVPQCPTAWPRGSEQTFGFQKLWLKATKNRSPSWGVQGQLPLTP
ncbi:Uncharacterised protein [Chlamydia abortus]|nr:Uncharacterised protein [Chlamydia abortus]